jgi:1-acyl-sn-glycerol-3-phosphate acyltransferase
MLPCAAVPGEPSAKPLEPLYDAVAFGMWMYTRAAFRVEDLDPRYKPRPGRLLVSSHRAETDVPLLCPSMYREGGYLRDRAGPRIHFAARDDMFERGFFAGFPPGLPSAVRRLLYPLDAGRLLPRVRVHPVPYPSASTLRLGRALAELDGETPLEQVLPATLVVRFEARASDIGKAPPRTAGEALQGAYADLLWRFCSREELSIPLLEPAWARRAQQGAEAVRQLVETIRSGAILLVFPEGRPSPDGAIGPLRKGLGTLVRRGQPEAIVPIAIAYDPITRGRARAFVCFGEEFRTPTEGLEEAVLAALRRWTPLTCGQVVAHTLLASSSGGIEQLTAHELDVVLEAAVQAAAREGRPIERALSTPAERRVRLSEALSFAVDAELATSDRRTLFLDGERILGDHRIARLAREFESAREEPRD